jgi:chromosome segregation protein
MRLEKIKLAGFKSFVDPTTVPIPSNLVGIVGPNGCGKSNIIDAVRWVMGESSAKMLRGESMSDVIFNGSSSRKPVGMAGIELIFDNSDGSAGGQYAKYSQISVKRQVQRDGQSSYMLNGVRCRRRDITDLFLGTGLGPRSYSIIEQGMISRLIEAKPEDLRAFLEEAAGISKYKERRRETENRIRHTRDNLSRLNDLLEEVEKQLQRLKRQASTAARYKKLKQQERMLKGEMLALRSRAMDDSLKQQQTLLREEETKMEAAVAAQRKLESEIEQGRSEQHTANERFNQVQGQFYKVGSEIARLEQSIKHATEVAGQQELDLEQIGQAWRESEELQDKDSEQLKELAASLEQDEPHLKAARESEQAASQRLAQEERTLQAWQNEWDEFNRQAAEPAQTAQVERARINHLEQQQREMQARYERLTEELQRLHANSMQQEIEQLLDGERGYIQKTEGMQQQLSLATKNIHAVRDTNAKLVTKQDEVKVELHKLKGRLASLEALQEAALGRDKSGVSEWLEQKGLDRAARLAEKIEVESGWQKAAEVVLGFHLQAVCTDDMTTLGGDLEGLGEGSLTLFDTTAPATGWGSGDDWLLRRIKSPWPLDSLLAGVRVAESLNIALEMRSTLKIGESLITRDGVWIGSDWLRLSRESDQGLLQRGEEIKQLTRQQQELERRVDEYAMALKSGKESLQQAEQSREQMQGAANKLQEELADVRSNLSGRKAQAEHLKSRDTTVRHEMAELKQQMERDQSELQQSQQRLHTALEEIDSLGKRREALSSQRERLRQAVDSAKREAQQQRAKEHEIALKIESMRSSYSSLNQNLERMKGQIVHLSTRREELLAAIRNSKEPLQAQHQELERQLKQRVGVEDEMKAARQGLERVEAELRSKEQQRSEAEQQVQRERDSLEQEKMRRQELLVRHQTIDEQIKEAGLVRDELLAQLPEDANLEEWEERLVQIGTKISRLGAINLAAIDEFEEQSERKT